MVSLQPQPQPRLHDNLACRLSNNLSGQYKRGIGMALHIGIGNFSGAIASNIFRTQDKPRFILGRTSNVISVFLQSLTEYGLLQME